MFIELHMLQNFSPSNLNRDDSNSPKECTFGGVRRARISSQCIKRAIRLHPSFQETTQVEPSARTRFLVSAISSLLQEAGKPKDEAEKASVNVVGAILGGMDSKNPLRSKVLFFVSAEENRFITKLILDNWEAALTGKVTEDKALQVGIKAYKDAFNHRTSAPEIAMFGRMLAEDPTLNVDAACQVAHAISTHRVNMEFDFFTAVDDLQSETETGAGMMGIIGFNAATFYRYSLIDFDQLVNNLGGDLALARKTVEGFLKAAVAAVPTGKQTSFAAQNPPSFIMAVTREDGAAWSLANAFEKPVYPRGDQSLLDASVVALDAYWGDLLSFYGGNPNPVVAEIGIKPQLQNLEAYSVNNMDAWLNQVLIALPGE